MPCSKCFISTGDERAWSAHRDIAHAVGISKSCTGTSCTLPPWLTRT